MLYAYPGDLTDEARAGRSALEWIDSRYVGPLVHELSHLHEKTDRIYTQMLENFVFEPPKSQSRKARKD